MAEELTPSVGWQIADALTAVAGGGRGGSTSGIATVSSIDSEGRVWVHLPGGVDETPVNGSSVADCDPGQSVSYTVENGRLSITGNASNPSVGQDNVDRTVAPISLRVDTISELANRAYEAADAAVSDASRANEAASSAQSSANSAAVAAGSAQTSANAAAVAAGEAQASADNANEYAARALGNLSSVQSVTETLAWITQHGTMTLTEDTEPDPTHVYFVADAGGDYVVGSTHYSLVIEPVAADMATYYELTIDESLNNYVGTHLSLTAEGLWLLPATSGTHRILIATGAGSTYTTAGTYIIDAGGNVVDQFGEVTRMGRADESHIDIDYHSMRMIDKEGDTYFHVSDLRDRSGTTEIVESRTYWDFLADYWDILPYSFGLTFEAEPSGWHEDEEYESDEPELVPEYDYQIKVDGVTVASGVERTARYFTPDYEEGMKDEDGNVIVIDALTSIVEVTYRTADPNVKALTFGSRGTGPLGAVSVAEGEGCVASGNFSHAEGRNTKASGLHSHSEGEQSEARGSCSHVEGYDTFAGSYSHAEGYDTGANSSYSHAEGYQSHTYDSYAHAEGYSTFAGGEASHAEGYDTEATGDYAHAEGYKTYADSQNSHAEGYGSRAYGIGAHVEGYSCYARGKYAHAQNYYTNAYWDYQTAIGKYNKYTTGTNDNLALIIGNGTSSSNLSNALTVDWDGYVEAGGATFTKPSSNATTTPLAINDGTSDVFAVGWDGNITSAGLSTAAAARLAQTADTSGARHRINLTTSGNLRIDRSTDGGTTWTAIGYCVPSGATGYLTTGKGGTGVTVTQESTLTVNTTNATAGSDNYCWHNGVVASFTYTFTLKASLANGSLVAVGTLPSGYRPPHTVACMCYTPTGANIQAYVNSSGTLNVRNGSGAAIGTDLTMRISGTYAIEI